MTARKRNVLGVLGGGQLGKMFAQAANTLGFRVCVYAPEEASVASHASYDQIMSGYDDSLSLEKFARDVDAVTFEFENVPASVSEHIAKHTILRPGAAVLEIAQNRIKEKEFFKSTGIPVAPCAGIQNEEDLDVAFQQTGSPAILKTAESGYDGKGQIEVSSIEELSRAWETLKKVPCILEQKISLSKEYSILIARNASGETALLGPIENEHKEHILFLSTSPASLTPDQSKKISGYITRIADALALEGILCLELFVDSSGEILANEMAPRPHNSGHLSIEAHAQSQFDLQVRAVADLPLFTPETTSPAAMVNLLGDLWEAGRSPNFEKVLRHPRAYLHLYGKEIPRKGRKMGHITVLAESAEAAKEEVLGLFESLSE